MEQEGQIEQLISDDIILIKSLMDLAKCGKENGCLINILKLSLMAMTNMIWRKYFSFKEIVEKWFTLKATKERSSFIYNFI